MKKLSKSQQERAAYLAAVRAHEHLKRCEDMGNFLTAREYARLFHARAAVVFPERYERPEFPYYVGTDGQEHSVF